jgi:hypothetical protein
MAILYLQLWFVKLWNMMNFQCLQYSADFSSLFSLLKPVTVFQVDGHNLLHHWVSFLSEKTGFMFPNSKNCQFVMFFRCRNVLQSATVSVWQYDYPDITDQKHLTWQINPVKLFMLPYSLECGKQSLSSHWSILSIVFQFIRQAISTQAISFFMEKLCQQAENDVIHQQSQPLRLPWDSLSISLFFEYLQDNPQLRDQGIDPTRMQGRSSGLRMIQISTDTVTPKATCLLSSSSCVA